MHEGWQTLAAIVGGIFTVAIVAVIVGRNAQTSTVIQSAGTALQSVITAAVAPVSSASGSSGFLGGA